MYLDFIPWSLFTQLGKFNYTEMGKQKRESVSGTEVGLYYVWTQSHFDSLIKSYSQTHNIMTLALFFIFVCKVPLYQSSMVALYSFKTEAHFKLLFFIDNFNS